MFARKHHTSGIAHKLAGKHASFCVQLLSFFGVASVFEHFVGESMCTDMLAWTANSVGLAC